MKKAFETKFIRIQWLKTARLLRDKHDGRYWDCFINNNISIRPKNNNTAIRTVKEEGQIVLTKPVPITQLEDISTVWDYYYDHILELVTKTESSAWWIKNIVKLHISASRYSELVGSLYKLFPLSSAPCKQNIVWNLWMKKTKNSLQQQLANHFQKEREKKA